jgi:hypothetical protein
MNTTDSTKTGGRKGKRAKVTRNYSNGAVKDSSAILAAFTHMYKDIGLSVDDIRNDTWIGARLTPNGLRQAIARATNNGFIVPKTRDGQIRYFPAHGTKVAIVARPYAN